MASSRIGGLKILLLCVGIVPGMTAVAGSAVAQEGVEDITIAAVAAVRPAVGPGAAGLDVSRLCRAQLAEWRCSAVVSAALGRLRLAPANREFTYVCPSGTRSCRLVGVQHFLVPGAPRIRGANAQVSVSVLSARSAGEGVAEVMHQVHLVRQGGGWRVVRVDAGR